MIDSRLITRKLLLIGKDLPEIQQLANCDIQEYLRDPHAEVLAERYLERIIGRMIDINYHLITESGSLPPVDYHQSFLQLGELGVLAPEFARRLSSCAGLRNRIAHEYEAIDPLRVHAALQDAAADFPVYMRHVEAFLTALEE
jgi:uncharacterized protein YutE (UPF0331/DUF86 family)